MLKSTGADAKNPKAVHVNLQKAQFVAVLNTSINISRNLNRYFVHRSYIVFIFFLYFCCFNYLAI